jgi:dienelactone hydrolase
MNPKKSMPIMGTITASTPTKCQPMPMRIRFALLSLLTLSVLGCSSSDSDNGTEASATSENSAEAYFDRGPHPVGVSTLTLERGPKVEVWYPAVEGTVGTDTYDVRDYTPDAIKKILTGNAPATFTIDAGRDVDVAEGKHPVVLFSHGYSGIRVQSSFITSHLASWGMVVISPDHWSRDLNHVFGNNPVGDRESAVADLFDSLDLVAADPRFSEAVDVERLIAVGHSAGGGTVARAARDERIDGFVSMASGALESNDQSTNEDVPQKPTFYIAGRADQVTPVDTVTRPAFDAAASPSLLWVMDKVGHNGFDDFCTFGNGKGIIGVAEASGLGALLSAQPQFKSLGEDGCVGDVAPSTVAFPIIRHAITAWSRHVLGLDKTAIDLGPSVATSYALPIEIVTK